MVKTKPSIEFLKSILNFDAETGIFTWKVNRCGRFARVGMQAGYKRKDGYIEIQISKHSILIHRLAWAFHYGAYPNGVIDHLNGVIDDNKISNLRDVSQKTNIQNQKKCQKNNKTTGLLGSSFHKATGKYIAQISINNKPKYLGIFDTANAAHDRYLQEKRRVHEGCLI